MSCDCPKIGGTSCAVRFVDCGTFRLPHKGRMSCRNPFRARRRRSRNRIAHPLVGGAGVFHRRLRDVWRVALSGRGVSHCANVCVRKGSQAAPGIIQQPTAAEHGSSRSLQNSIATGPGCAVWAEPRPQRHGLSSSGETVVTLWTHW
jgi:hypothetical protein